MFTAVLVIMVGMFGYDNAEFFAEVKKENEQGYKWEYVGKTPASGVPAITMKSNGEEYILWKLK